MYIIVQLNNSIVNLLFLLVFAYEPLVWHTVTFLEIQQMVRAITFKTVSALFSIFLHLDIAGLSLNCILTIFPSF